MLQHFFYLPVELGFIGSFQQFMALDLAHIKIAMRKCKDTHNTSSYHI